MKQLIFTIIIFSVLCFVFDIVSKFVFPWVLLPASILTGFLVLKANE